MKKLSTINYYVISYILSVIFVSLFFSYLFDNEILNNPYYNFIFSLATVIASLYIGIEVSNHNKKDIRLPLSDEKKLLDKKRQFLENILETLSIDIDKELKSHLEKGDIEEANDLIEGKVKALNKLVETVKGDNVKSLRGTDISSVTDFYESTSIRIKTEISRINRNSNVNLFIGVITSMVAIGILVKGIEDHKLELMEIIPRATISILIEAFAFFFFSQYRKQQEDVKYWNNERTNLDLKIFALSIAIDDEKIGTKEFMRNIITGLINTERNTFGTTQIREVKEDKIKDKPEETKLVTDLLAKLKELSGLIPNK